LCFLVAPWFHISSSQGMFSNLFSLIGLEKTAYLQIAGPALYDLLSIETLLHNSCYLL
jgi:hypothetical protein